MCVGIDVPETTLFFGGHTIISGLLDSIPGTFLYKYRDSPRTSAESWSLQEWIARPNPLIASLKKTKFAIIYPRILLMVPSPYST